MSYHINIFDRKKKKYTCRMSKKVVKPVLSLYFLLLKEIIKFQLCNGDMEARMEAELIDLNR